MKPTKTSFLFFCFICAIFSHNTYGQYSSDSLQYYSNLALKPQNANDLVKAQNYFNIDYDRAMEKHNLESAINSLYYIASIKYKKGEYDDSEETAVKALELLDKIKHSDHKEDTTKSLYNLLGLMYTEQKNKSKAIDLYDRALKISKTASDSANIYNNISLVYKNFGDIDNAKLEILKAYKLIPKIKNIHIEALIIDNYGVLESKLNNSNGLVLMNKALKLRKSVSDTSKIYTSYSHLADHYYRTNNTKESKEYAIKAYELAEIINSASYRNNALGLLTKLSEDNYSKAYKKLNDSIYLAEKEASNKDLFIIYDFTKKEKELQKIKLKNEEQKKEKLFYLFLAVLILSSSIFLYFILKSKHKKDKIKAAYLKEAELSKKVHDELANDMSDLMNFVENDIEATHTKKSLLLDNIEDIYLRTRDISTETGSIDLVHFSESIKHLLMQHNRQDTKVITNTINTIDWQHIVEHQKMVIYRCLQELMVNMKKHSEAKVVSVIFKTLNNKNEIRYTDDGIGFETTEIHLNGLQNVESRIKGIGGSFKFTTSKGNGFKATLKFNR